jgi:hypothetical protein
MKTRLNTKQKHYISRMAKLYIELSEAKALRQNEYMQTISVKNKKTGEQYRLHHDFFKKFRSDYIWFSLKSYYFQSMAIEHGLRPVFITATLPSEYHPFTAKGFRNKEYLGIDNDGVSKINKFIRDLYHGFYFERSRVVLPYQRVIEPHKSFVPHVHALFYVPESHVESFKSHFDTMIERHGMGVQNELEVIDDASRSSAYLLKYIKKSYDASNPETARMIDGWKKSNRIRVFTSSNISVPRYVFEKVSQKLKMKVERGENILKIIEDLIRVDVVHYRIDGSIYKTRKYGNGTDIKVYIEKVQLFKRPLDEDVKEYLSKLRYNNNTNVIYNPFCTPSELYFHAIEYLSIMEKVIYFDHTRFDYENWLKTLDYSVLEEIFIDYVFEHYTRYSRQWKVRRFTIDDAFGNVYDSDDYELVLDNG